MTGALKFLVVDFHAESRFLLTKTLHRKFPDATMIELDEAEPAIERVRRREVDVVITHRTFDVPGVELVREFRAANATIPILMVSGIDREEAALEAGANRFLHYDQWLRLGTVVEELLGKPLDSSERARQPDCAA